MSAWNLTLKPSFLAEFQALPPKEARQVMSKLEMLTVDPTPDAKVKKHLTHLPGKLHRIRSGDYRILYTFEHPFVSVLAVRKRDEGTYDDVAGESLGGLAADMPGAPPAAPPAWPGQLDAASKPKKTPLPSPITEDLLRRLRVPDAYFTRLVAVTTEDDLLNCPGVPDDVLLRVDQALVERPLDQVLAQPDLVAQEASDLMRFKEGDLVGFLLKLDAEQQKYVGWRVKAAGPTLLKGGPGTGKSTVALYRTREMIAGLRAAGVRSPRLLFTTYTNALVSFSRQLLQAILGEDAALVDVRTADSLAMAIAAQGRTLAVADHEQARVLCADAARGAAFAGNLLQKKAQAQTIERLGVEYVLDEIREVIEARRLSTLEQYQAAARPGREAALNKTQREAVWRVREALVPRLQAKGLLLWEQVRARAAERVEKGEHAERYDAVLVDEAQDLQPAAIQMLTALCRAPNRLFFTADANQSIYGGGFRWHDVHEALHFTGRTGVLKANYRSTREIGEAANAYLASGEIDPERERAYANSGPMPAVRAVADVDQEARLLERYLRAASKELRIGLGSCAVLAPTEKAGQRLAEALRARDVPARYMSGKTLDLGSKEVKVLTLRSAKGLEFPVVAVAGFLDGPYPPLRPDAAEEEAAEITAKERRTMFVAMTRAMRALLVVIPERTGSPLLGGFDPRAWNAGDARG
jgi:superfamily I DNA/RNA helicase/mRNA-degrading endonuclease RelE of RelBE toxin-antitoxin system